MREKIIFNHIPKTGGWTVGAWLTQASVGSDGLTLAYEDVYHVPGSPGWPTFYEQVKSGQVPQVSCIWGHIPYGLKELMPEGGVGWECMMVLREPLPLVFSMLKHFLSVEDHPAHPGVAGKTPSEILQGHIPGKWGTRWFNNVMTRYLCGEPGWLEWGVAGPQDEVIYDEGLLQKAKANLTKIKYLATTKTLGGFMEGLSRVWSFPPPKHVKLNTRPSSWEASLDSEVIDRVRHLNQMDAELYGFAQEHLWLTRHVGS